MSDYEYSLGFNITNEGMMLEPTSYQEEGYPAGTKLPAQHFNWILNQMSRCIEELHDKAALKSEHQIKSFDSLDDIGITAGQETIVAILEKLPTNSNLRYGITSSHNTSIYPQTMGAVEFRKNIAGYVDITFWCYSTVADKRGTWEAKAYYTSGEWKFYGWSKNFDEHHTPTPSEIGAIPYSADRKDLKEGDDLNSFLTVGCWRCTTNINAKTLVNCPVEVAFTLDIVPAMGYHEQVATSNGSIIQKLTTHFGDFYYRRIQNVDGAISYDNWTQSYDERHKPTPDEIDGVMPILKGGTGADDWEEAQTNLKLISRQAHYYRPESNPNIDTLTDSLMLIPRDFHKNCPVSGNFVYIMQVFYAGITATSNRTQIAFPYSSSTETGIGMAVRTFNGGTWSEWQEIYGSLNKPTPKEIGASDSGHGHVLTSDVLTGKLPIEKGGTNATNVTDARTNLNFGITGEYTGTANSTPSSVMYDWDTGAKGSNLLMIVGGSYVGWLTPDGGIMTEHGASTYFAKSTTFEGWDTGASHIAYYRDGHIYLKTTSDFINGQGYHYKFICM